MSRGETLGRGYWQPQETSQLTCFAMWWDVRRYTAVGNERVSSLQDRLRGAGCPLPFSSALEASGRDVEERVAGFSAQTQEHSGPSGRRLLVVGDLVDQAL